MFKIKSALLALLLLALPAWAATPATSIVSGTLYDGSGNPRANTTVVLNLPQQVIGGATITAQVLSTRTDSAGALTPIQLPQNAILSIAVGTGMPVTGCVPLTSTADIAVVLTCTLSAVSPGGGGAIQINGVGIQSQATINFINGQNITVSNPSGGVIKHDLTGQVLVANGGTGVSSLGANGVLIGQGTGNVQVTTAGTLGQCLMSNGSGVNPSFQTCPGAAGSGITSLNGQTGNSQTFANDTNVTIASAANVHQLGWTGLLALSRGGTNQNTWTASRCVQVNAGGTALESASGPCGTSSGGTSTVVVKSTNESVSSSIVLQNDNELTFAIGASETWAVKVVIFYQSGGNNTGNLKIGMNGPSGLAGLFGAVGKSVDDSTTLSQSAVNLAQNFVNTGSSNNYQALTAASMLVMEAIVVNDITAGNVTLEWAQTNSSTDATTILAGSYLVAIKQ